MAIASSADLRSAQVNRTVGRGIENLKPWKPGQSGNPGGRPKKTLVDEALATLLDADESAKATQIAEMLIQKAINGDVRAAQLIMERTEGKPLQKVALRDESDESPVKFVIEFVGAEGPLP
jgi:hypothetical protein